MKYFWLLVVVCLLTPALRADTTPPRPPNIVIISIDDLGWADVGPFKPDDAGYETPHLDRLAREGRTFTNFYASDSVCSASRAALLTGCYHVRVGIFGALSPRAEHGLHPDEVTIAEICKQHDYATACFGKWHLGHHKKFLPLAQGFDTYFGLPYSNDMWPYHPLDELHHFPALPLIEQNEVIDANVTAEVQQTLTQEYTRRAIDFISANKDRPFFLYVPHTMVHVPLFVSDEFANQSQRGLFGDVVQEVDWSVGRIIEALREHGLAENTWVIFTSDNGPWLGYGNHAGSAGPLREGKGTSFEGGVRVPTIMWWPDTIPADTRCDVPAMMIDILPTVARVIDAKLPDHPIDGKDIWPLVADEPGADSPHEACYFYLHDHLEAVRMGRWKLHFPHKYRHEEPGADGQPAGTEYRHIELSLFDLESDPGETRDVKAEHPDVVERIQQLADEMRQDLGDQGQSAPDRRPAGQL